MKTGVNSVLWGGHPLEDAFAGASRAGYDGIELSAIPQMSEHLVLDRWAQLVCNQGVGRSLWVGAAGDGATKPGPGNNGAGVRGGGSLADPHR